MPPTSRSRHRPWILAQKPVDPRQLKSSRIILRTTGTDDPAWPSLSDDANSDLVTSRPVRRITGPGCPPIRPGPVFFQIDIMHDLTPEQARRATRLKLVVDLARADYDRAQGPGWTERELQAAAAHYRLCDEKYRTFMAHGLGQDEQRRLAAKVRTDIDD